MPDTRNRVAEMLKAGLKVKEISGAVNVTKQRVYQIMQEEGLPTPSEVEHGYRTRVEVIDQDNNPINTFYAQVGGYGVDGALKLIIERPVAGST